MTTPPSYTCSLCGHIFSEDKRSCPSACPLSRHCNLVCCPNCGYSFPGESRTIAFFKGLIKKKTRKSHELSS